MNRALSGAWKTGLLPRPVLDPQLLEAAALGGRPSTAFGETGLWREPLRRLTSSLQDQADLNPLGEAMAHGQIMMALKARIRAIALWKKHPGILQRPVRPPILILGQMRSGTTRLQRLLACDERLAHTRMFESLMPVPQSGRRLRAAAGLRFLRLLNPEVHRIHPSRPMAPEEEFGLFSFSFGSAQFEAQWRVPDFATWWEETDRSWLYQEFRSLLRTIAWSRGEPESRRWILKAPQFLQDLPDLLSVFPDACLIFLERDRKQVVASSASLVWNQMRIQSDRADPNWVGREWLRKTRLRDRRVAQWRSASESPGLRIDHEDMNRDWRGQMRRIYDHIGLELSEELLGRMAAYLDGASEHQGHRYSLDQFGLTPEDVAPGQE